MSAPDPASRLDVLRRQRDLLREHLAWLEREITAAEHAAGGETAEKSKLDSTETTAPGPSFVPAAGANSDAHFKTTAGEIALGKTKPPAAPGETDAEAEAILDEYRTPNRDLQRDVKRGCFLYFAAALLVFGAAVVILYFALRHK